jgi:hypothetical protein
MNQVARNQLWSDGSEKHFRVLAIVGDDVVCKRKYGADFITRRSNFNDASFTLLKPVKEVPLMQSKAVEAYKLPANLAAIIKRCRELDQSYERLGRPHPGTIRLSPSQFGALDRAIRKANGDAFGLSECTMFGRTISC